MSDSIAQWNEQTPN